MCAGALGCQKRTSDLLDMEFRVIVNCPTKALETELRSFSRAVCPLNHSAISQAPVILIFKQNWH